MSGFPVRGNTKIPHLSSGPGGRKGEHPMIQLLAVMRAKPGREKELEAAFSAFVEKARAEEGTLAYILHKSLSDPARFMFYESYADEAALKAHSKSPHMAALFGQVADMLDGQPQIEMYRELARK